MKLAKNKKSNELFDYILFDGKNLEDVKKFISNDIDLKIMTGDNKSNPVIICQNEFYKKWGTLIKSDYLLMNKFCEVVICDSFTFLSDYEIVQIL